MQWSIIRRVRAISPEIKILSILRLPTSMNNKGKQLIWIRLRLKLQNIQHNKHHVAGLKVAVFFEDNENQTLIAIIPEEVKLSRLQ